ncbi:MAG TPA: nucleotidyltransferase family protein [Rhodanobacteraceae bacterium]|jgi:CTP:molybdopterin cytidylyltransferase MocA|nr:nucleotidyltransferase family protein [Rhodanobacteraceae bacterium]
MTPQRCLTPAHGAIVLAAGASTRLGRAKQLIDIDGEPLLRRVTRRVLATEPEDCVVVLGHDAERIGSVLEGLDVRVLRLRDADSGMAASLRAGLLSLDALCAGALIVLTDQPALTVDHLDALCMAWRAEPARAVASAYAGVLGVPAILPRDWFEEIIALRGDVGARALLRARSDEVTAIAAPELAADIDRVDDIPR